MLALLISLAAQAAAPAPTELHTFRDWTVACDNGRACKAIALIPEESDWEGWTTLSLRRDPAAGAQPAFLLPRLDVAPESLVADGEPIQARFRREEEGYALEPVDPDDFIGRLRNAQRLEVQDARGNRLSVSLAGASAAMLYMDEAQRRLDTVTALVRRGPRPASAVPAPPALPRVRLAPAPAGAPLAIGAERIEALRRQEGCTIEEVGEPDTHETLAIAEGTTLILLSCGSGAYNLSSIPLIARRRGRAIDISVAPFDRQQSGFGAEGQTTLVNAYWDPETGLLREFPKARGIGDCGTRSAYGWDGTRFRLVEQEEMGECRGSTDYVTTWRAEAVRP